MNNMQIHARIAALRCEYTYEIRVWAGTAEDGEPDLMFAFPHKASLLSADRYAQNLGTALWAFLIRDSTLPSKPADRLRIMIDDSVLDSLDEAVAALSRPLYGQLVGRSTAMVPGCRVTEYCTVQLGWLRVRDGLVAADRALARVTG
jgi:hypothetical protein